jgi:hypothetical protein
LRIVVASARSPFAGPATRRPADELVAVLRIAGHQVEQVWLPVNPDPFRVIQQHLTIRLTDVQDAGEIMITMRAPSHLLRHSSKVVWFDCEAGARVSEETAAADRVGIGDARRVFVTSTAAGRRLHAATGIEAPVLAPDRLDVDPAEVLSALLG